MDGITDSMDVNLSELWELVMNREDWYAAIHIPGLGRSPGEGNGNPLQYSCLKNPVDRGAWQATVHGVVSQRVRHD